MNKYLLHGKLIAKTGYRDELVKILLDASKLLSKANGCILYVIGRNENEANPIYVTEIWDSKEYHDSSLKVQGIRELIMKAIPILEEQPAPGHELEILGGIGI